MHVEGEETVGGTETTVNDERGIVLSDDDAMSVGDSEEDETGTDEFSGESGSSSCGESIVSRTNRKRMAEESSEREPAGTSRKEFPGAVTRSEGGCRIYVPPEFSGPGGSGDRTTVIECDVRMGDVSVVATETSAIADVIIRTGVVGSGTLKEKDMAERSECMLRGDVVRGETVVTSGTRMIELETTGGVDTSNTAIEMPKVAAKDTIEEMCVDVTTMVSCSTIASLMVAGGDEAEVVTRQSSSATVVAAAEVDVMMAPSTAVTLGCQVRQPVVDGWARDARMVEGIFQIMEGMEPPWITLNVLEIAAVRFPDVDRETLRLTIVTMIMSQRRCVVRLTRAGLRLGPRTDWEGNAYIELDLDFADRYSTSH